VVWEEFPPSDITMCFLIFVESWWHDPDLRIFFRDCMRLVLLKWEKPVCFRTWCNQASKSSSIFSVRTAFHRRQIF
jgi:hypothetical protein